MKKACQFISLETNKINLDNLIENIYVSPYVDDYFIEGINSLIEKYDISNDGINIIRLIGSVNLR
jgi:hypothetical protein